MGGATIVERDVVLCSIVFKVRQTFSPQIKLRTNLLTNHKTYLLPRQ